MFEPVDYVDYASGALIKVVGVGGGGGNAVNHMVTQSAKNERSDDTLIGDEFAFGNDEGNGKIVFYAVNTDAQALRKSSVEQTIQIGASVTKGLGAGANPNVGRKSAEDDHEALRTMLEGADMVFIAAGMGGGTGTGAAPVVAQIAKELGILTVAVVTKPFSFEGRKRMQFAEMGIKELSKYVDSLIIIPNDKLLKVLGKNITLVDAFAAANDILRNAVTGISDVITSPGMVNLDFADVKTVMSEMGRAMMGASIVKGSAADGRAEKAAQEAVASPLLEDVDLSGARGVLVNVTGGLDVTMYELDLIGEQIRSFASEDATVIVGTSIVPEMVDEIRVTIVATGIGDITPSETSAVSRQNTTASASLERQNVSSSTSFNRASQANVESRPDNRKQESNERNVLDIPITDRLAGFRKEGNIFSVENFVRKTEE